MDKVRYRICFRTVDDRNSHMPEIVEYPDAPSRDAAHKKVKQHINQGDRFVEIGAFTVNTAHLIKLYADDELSNTWHSPSIVQLFQDIDLKADYSWSGKVCHFAVEDDNEAQIRAKLARIPAEYCVQNIQISPGEGNNKKFQMGSFEITL